MRYAFFASFFFLFLAAVDFARSEASGSAGVVLVIALAYVALSFLAWKRFYQNAFPIVVSLAALLTR